MSTKIEKTQEQWRRELSPEQYRVMRDKGTERAFTGTYNDAKLPGVYRCAGCKTELFDSETKFDSGTGWPSFHSPADTQNVVTQTDRGFFMRRTEVLCATCDAHLGHLFGDGPAPTGQRYCINSVCLILDPREG